MTFCLAFFSLTTSPNNHPLLYCIHYSIQLSPRTGQRQKTTSVWSVMYGTDYVRYFILFPTIISPLFRFLNKTFFSCVSFYMMIYVRTSTVIRKKHNTTETSLNMRHLLQYHVETNLTHTSRPSSSDLSLAAAEQEFGTQFATLTNTTTVNTTIA